MGDTTTLIGGIGAIIVGLAAAIKLWPVIASNLSATIASNKANENTVNTLQEIIQSERTGRLAAEAENRKMISEWAEMKAKFDLITSQLSDAMARVAKTEIINANLTNQVQQLTEQLAKAHL